MGEGTWPANLWNIGKVESTLKFNEFSIVHGAYRCQNRIRLAPGVQWFQYHQEKQNSLTCSLYHLLRFLIQIIGTLKFEFVWRNFEFVAVTVIFLCKNRISEWVSLFFCGFLSLLHIQRKVIVHVLWSITFVFCWHYVSSCREASNTTILQLFSLLFVCTGVKIPFLGDQENSRYVNEVNSYFCHWRIFQNKEIYISTFLIATK